MSNNGWHHKQIDSLVIHFVPNKFVTFLSIIHYYLDDIDRCIGKKLIQLIKKINSKFNSSQIISSIPT